MIWLIGLAFFSSSLFAQGVAVARISDISIPVQGSIVFKNQEKFKAPFDGRVELVDVQDKTWVKAGKPLAYLADTQTAALLKYKGMTPNQLLLKRWKSMYSLSVVSCPKDCLILHHFVSGNQRIKTQDSLFKVAYKIALVGKIPAQYAAYIRNGQDLVFWSVSNPEKKKRIKIQNYSLNKETPPSGTFVIPIPLNFYSRDIRWAGRITLAQSVLSVPTSSLITYQGKVFLPMEVVSGITTDKITEIKASEALSEHSPVLILSDAQINKAFRYSPQRALSLQPEISTATASVHAFSHAQPSSQTVIPKKPKGPSFWQRLKAVKPLPSRDQQRKSSSDENYGN